MKRQIERIWEKYFFWITSIFGAAMIAIVVLMIDIRDDVALLKSDAAVLQSDVTALKSDVEFLTENAMLKTDAEFIKRLVYEVLDETGLLGLAAKQ